jgi:hypothetical protein
MTEMTDTNHAAATQETHPWHTSKNLMHEGARSVPTKPWLAVYPPPTSLTDLSLTAPGPVDVTPWPRKSLVTAATTFLTTIMFRLRPVSMPALSVMLLLLAAVNVRVVADPDANLHLCSITTRVLRSMHLVLRVCWAWLHLQHLFSLLQDDQAWGSDWVVSAARMVVIELEDGWTDLVDTNYFLMTNVISPDHTHEFVRYPIH